MPFSAEDLLSLTIGQAGMSSAYIHVKMLIDRIRKKLLPDLTNHLLKIVLPFSLLQQLSG